MVNGVYNDNGIKSCSDMMMQVAGFCQTGQVSKIHTVWKEVVSKVHSFKDEDIDSEKRIPIGQRLAGNTRVVDLKNGVLLVETDHPGWIQYLNMYKKFIIKGLHMYLPDLDIRSLAFRVKGSEVRLSEQYDAMVKESQAKIDKRLDEQQKEIDKVYEGRENSNTSDSSKLPPELLAKFESIKNDMLTKNKN